MPKWVFPLINIILITVLLFLILRLCAVKCVFSQKSTAKLAIIIDDFGNNSDGTAEMLTLPIMFTAAVMPNMPYSKKECEDAVKNGKAYILHQPMQAHTGSISWLGKNPILMSLSPQKAAEIFAQNAESLGHPEGFNNHMGSAVTEDEEKMDAIMKAAAEKGMFFVDSLTTSKSAAEKYAKKYGVPYIKRDVFLDSTQDIEKIKANLLKAAEIAKKNGTAAAIGHVGAEGGTVTAAAINQTYKQIEEMGVEFAAVRDLVRR